MTTSLTSPAPTPSQARNLAEVIDRLMRFDGSPEAFLGELSRVMCEMGGAKAAAIVRSQSQPAQGQEKPAMGVMLLGVHPPMTQQGQPPAWLGRAIGVLSNPEVLTQVQAGAAQGLFEIEADSPERRLFLVPGRRGGAAGAVATQLFVVFLVEWSDYQTMAILRQRLSLMAGLLALFDVRMGYQQRTAALQQMNAAVEVLAASSEQGRFRASAMAFCNSLAARWSAERVTLGFLRGRYVRLRAMSHTEKFTRKTKLAQDVESAMEECLDQDEEVMHPAPPGTPAGAVVNRAAAALSERHGPTRVLSIPLRREAQVVAVVTLERAMDKPFTTDELETLRLTSDLCTANLMTLHDHDRWFYERWAADWRQMLATLVGPRYTWAKVIAAALLAAVLLMVFVKGPYRADAPFVVQAVERRVVPAPFAGYIFEVNVEPNDRVEAGQLLARLDRSELQMRLTAVRSEMVAAEKKSEKALQEGKTADHQIARAEADRAAAEARLLDFQISKADIVAPIAGVVLTGELKRQLGAPVEVGNILFEIAPIESLRAELAVDERDVASVTPGMTGTLASVSTPGTYYRFQVEHVNPVAELVNRRNVFKVRAKLLEQPEDFKVGMEGVAKVDLGRRSYLRIWTLDAERWLRMKLWI